MESTHGHELAHAIRGTNPGSLKTAALLYKGRELESKFDEQDYCSEKLHLTNLDSTGSCIENFTKLLPKESNQVSANQSAFLPIKQKEAEDESVVSSTTNEKKVERPLPCESSSRLDSSHLDAFSYNHHNSRSKIIAETAAASSTTSFEDDEERLQTQASSGKGRRGGILDDGRPPSCGTPLGIIREGQPSSTTTEENTCKITKDQQNESDFLKPSDMAINHKHHRSAINQQQMNDHPMESEDTSGANGNKNKAPHSFSGNIGSENPAKEGVFSMDSRQIQMQMGQGINRSPIFSDVSLIPLSPQPIPGLGGTNQFNPNSPLDLYLSGYASPTMSMLSQARNISPRHSMQGFEKMNPAFYGSPFNMGQAESVPQGQMGSFPGNFAAAQGMNQLAYYQFMQQQQQKWFAMSLEKPDELGRLSSQFSRSRARKRPLSISPAFSDGFDINTMIRTSPNSLLPTGYLNGSGLGASRCSSAASGGSYGHLAAGGISPTGYMSGYNTPRMMTSPQLQFFSRQMPMPDYVGGMPPGQSIKTMENSDSIPNPFYPVGGSHRNYRPQQSVPIPGTNPNSMPQGGSGVKMLNKLGAEQPNTSIQYNTSNNNSNSGVSPGSHQNNDENDVIYATNCEWEGCTKEFDTQEQLVQHINNVHIHGDKKEFACHWKDCAREKRPFKAQYMLVVHMRRHTGEKPHKCTFKNCSKAYSRLENLKTHLRSHTGEKPYVCEYPSCTKAFSNASDRAKHQNRTHSNEKPYVCKITGCTKRYTDPSSLRKHVKTVHGPEAHVTKRMKATREREERKSEINVKKEPGIDKDKKKSDENNSRQNCQPASYQGNQQYNDSNPPSNTNPKSNQSSYTSGSDVTPHNSPHMTSQNNDSGVDVNVGANDADSDGDIVVDANPLPDSTSGGVAVRSQNRTNLRAARVPRHFSKKMATLSLVGPGDIDRSMGEYPMRHVEGSYLVKDKSPNQGTETVTEVSSTTLNSKLLKVKKYLMNNTVTKRRHTALIKQDRRDSGTVSDVSRKSSSASQSSRKSSQISNAGINVAGSYDPISLDSSRRSSSNSYAPAIQNPNGSTNGPSINPYDLHSLQSKYSEIAGLPPPTPISGEPYNKPHSKSIKNEDHQGSVNLHQGGFPNRNPKLQPTPPPRGPNGEPHTRRRSEDVYLRPNKTPVSGEMPCQRRASDPIRKTAQMDPNKLPSVQRYSSWNNMNPLPDIQSRNSNYDQKVQCNYEMVQHNVQVPQKTNSNGSFFGGNSVQQHHQAHFNQHGYHPHAGFNEQTLLNNLNADTRGNGHSGMETMNKNQHGYGNMMPPANVLSPAINPMSPGNVMSLGNVMSSPMSQMTQSHAMQRHCPPVNTSTAYQNVINQQPIMNQPVITSQHQQHFYDNAVINATSLYNNSYSMHAPMVSHPPMGVPIMGPPHQPAPHNFTHVQSFNNYGQQPPFCHPNTRSTHPDQHSNPPHSIPLQSGPHTGYQDTIIPRPPSHSSSSASSRLRMSRLRHASFPSGQHVGSGPSGTEECGRPTPRINYTPDAQIPDEFLQQEFIDSIPELQPDSINQQNEAQSYVKMAADSTTGPEGDENDDAMSTTNTDVTLPPMSAFSSRMGTPLMNKCYPPQHPLIASNQHPGSNMAISSMSSMLSALEEENKYLNMMPPKQ